MTESKKITLTPNAKKALRVKLGEQRKEWERKAERRRRENDWRHKV